MLKSQELKLATIEGTQIIVGVDIAKKTNWAVMISPTNRLLQKAFSFNNTKEGFESLVDVLEKIKEMLKAKNVIVGMEPTGHYWKPLANYLFSNNIKVVMVNSFHVKKAKELDDNSPTKNDKKDALTIARLIKDGRYNEVYIPEGVYADLRNISNTRFELIRKRNAVKNRVVAIMDEYFPEYGYVFKGIFCKTSIQILKNCPFPEDIKLKGVEEIITLIKKEVKKLYSKKQIIDLKNNAIITVGVTRGIVTAKMQLKMYIEDYELLERQIQETEEQLEKLLEQVPYAKQILEIPAIGTVNFAHFLGEIGDLTRFSHWQQVRKYAGYNLMENSSGEHKGKSKISKRGRHMLRSVLYQMALVMIAKNEEIKQLYGYLTKRKNNPLKKKQAVVAVIGKILSIIFALVKKQEKYDSTKVFNQERQLELIAA